MSLIDTVTEIRVGAEGDATALTLAAGDEGTLCYVQATDAMLVCDGAASVQNELERALKVQSVIQGGDTIANTAAATVFATTYTFPANAFVVGRALRVTAQGVYSTLVAVPGNLTLDIKAGATVMCTTGAQALVAAVANQGWRVSGFLVCQTIGVGGTVEAQGRADINSTPVVSTSQDMENVAAVALDTTLAQAIGIQVTFSVADPANTIRMRQFFVETMRSP